MDLTRTFEDGDGVEITLERDRIIRAVATSGSPYISVDYKPHVWATSEGKDPAPASASIMADVAEFERWSGIEVSQIKVISPETDRATSMKEQVLIGGKDYTDTDPKARQIIDHLARLGNLREDCPMPSVREIVNLVLKAQAELSAAQAA